MSEVGKIDLAVARDVAAGAEITLQDLFPSPEKDKRFTLGADVTLDVTPLKVNVPKVGVIDTPAGVTKKKGEETSLWLVMRSDPFLIKRQFPQAIKEGDVLTVTVETA